MSCPTMGPGRLQNLEVSSKRMSERIDNLARRERDRATWRFFVFESFDLVALAQIAQFVRGDRV